MNFKLFLLFVCVFLIYIPSWSQSQATTFWALSRITTHIIYLLGKSETIPASIGVFLPMKTKRQCIILYTAIRFLGAILSGPDLLLLPELSSLREGAQSDASGRSGLRDLLAILNACSPVLRSCSEVGEVKSWDWSSCWKVLVKQLCIVVRTFVFCSRSLANEAITMDESLQKDLQSIVLLLSLENWHVAALESLTHFAADECEKLGIPICVPAFIAQFDQSANFSINLGATTAMEVNSATSTSAPLSLSLENEGEEESDEGKGRGKEQNLNECDSFFSNDDDGALNNGRKVEGTSPRPATYDGLGAFIQANFRKQLASQCSSLLGGAMAGGGSAQKPPFGGIDSFSSSPRGGIDLSSSSPSLSTCLSSEGSGGEALLLMSSSLSPSPPPLLVTAPISSSFSFTFTSSSSLPLAGPISCLLDDPEPEDAPLPYAKIEEEEAWGVNTSYSISHRFGF